MASRTGSLTCIWLDSNVDSNADNKSIQDQLRQVFNRLHLCVNTGACEKQIRETRNERIILIVSGTFGREIVPRIHDLPQLVVFYVFCQDRKRNELWANQHPKVMNRPDRLKIDMFCSINLSRSVVWLPQSRNYCNAFLKILC